MTQLILAEVKRDGKVYFQIGNEDDINAGFDSRESVGKVAIIIIPPHPSLKTLMFLKDDQIKYIKEQTEAKLSERLGIPFLVKDVIFLG